MSKCKYCDAEIIWIHTSGGKKMPCDPEQVLYSLKGKDRIVTPNGEVLSCDIETDHEQADGIGYIPHFATCDRG